MRKMAQPSQFKRQNVPLCLINTRDCFAFDLIVKEEVIDMPIPYLIQSEASEKQSSKKSDVTDEWSLKEDENNIWNDESRHQDGTKSTSTA